MNVSLSFNNMFKWRGLVNIKLDTPFGYRNHTLTQSKVIVMCNFILSSLVKHKIVYFFPLAQELK
jgi:hypothetical protein